MPASTANQMGRSSLSIRSMSNALEQIAQIHILHSLPELLRKIYTRSQVYLSAGEEMLGSTQLQTS
jgi:hypothetical protein